MRKFKLTLLLVLTPFLFGFGWFDWFSTTDYTLEYTQKSWDVVSVSVKLVDGSEPYKTISYELQSSSGKTLYTGSNANIKIPDVKLGSKEVFTLIADVAFEGYDNVKKTVQLSASPKKLSMRTYLIKYPTDQTFLQGKYNITYNIERMVYGKKKQWERLANNVALISKMRVYVGDNKDNGVTVSLKKSSGTFLLNNYKDYRKFKDELFSRLEYDQIATVNFKITALLGGDKYPFNSTSETVKIKTEAERYAEVKSFARSAGRQIMSKVGDGRDFRVKVTGWEYNPADGKYEISMETYFNGLIYRSNNYEVDGVLIVNENGRSPKFTRSWANAKFKKLESRIRFWGGVAAGTYVLSELSK